MSYPHVLAADEQRELLRIARATLREHARTGRFPPGKPHRESLLAPAAVFVSLHVGGELRGCIGTTIATHPIYRAVQEMAVAAATRDPRFSPVVVDELVALEIEISVLGPLGKIASHADIVIGRDGVVVEGRGHRGLLLPQVAVESGWTAEAFVERTCQKAGLPRDAWRGGDLDLFVFSTQVFSEATATKPNLVTSEP
jgi:AmmeMemoRadiSam system protein A